MPDTARRKGCKMRKTWQKPKLVVLVRGRPEEFVLGPCKDVNVPATPNGPIVEQVDCIQNQVHCSVCSEVAGS
jgi:hypothetical protein